MTIRTTTATQRLDMMLAQAEHFVQAGLPREAFARAKQVIAYCERESANGKSGAEHAAIHQRELLAEGLVQRLGRSVRNSQGELKVNAADAAHPRAWSE